MLIHDGEQVLSALSLWPVNPAQQITHRGIHRQRDDLCPHHLAHEQDLQRVDRVLAAQVVAAAR